MASGSPPAEFDISVGPDVLLTAISVTTVVPEKWMESLQVPMPAEERLDYGIQMTALIWEPLENVRYVVSGDVDFDSFGMAPWDAGGMHGDKLPAS